MNKPNNFSQRSVATLAMISLVFISGSVQAIDRVGFHDGDSPSRDDGVSVKNYRLANKAASSFADSFVSGSLDRSRYSTPERIRLIEQGQLRSKTRSNNSTAGVNYTRTNNWLLGSDTHTSISSDIIITDVESGSANHPAFANIGGTFYSGSETVNGKEGFVFAQCKVGYRGNGLEAWLHVGTSLDTGFNTETVNAVEDVVPAGVIEQGDTAHVSLSYDGEREFTCNAQISFTESGGESSVFTATAVGPERLAEASGLKRVGTGLDWDDANNVVDSSNVAIDAQFDNVKSDGVLRDEFSAAVIDTSVWSNAEEVRTVEDVEEGYAVRLEASSADVKRDVDLEVKDSTDYLEADLMLSSRSELESVRGLIRLQGQWYNDTYEETYNQNEGDVYAHIALEKQSAELGGNYIATAFAGRLDENGNDAGSLFSVQFSTSVVPDRFYTASIENTPSAVLFTFNDERQAMPKNTNSYAPFYPVKKIRTRVYDAGRTVSYVDNVRTNSTLAFELDGDATTDGDDTDSSSSGGGGVIFLLLPAMLALFRRRKQG